jgi:N-acetylmuramic acid 6-phosphate etherase
MSQASDQKAKQFLDISSQYKLGSLITEAPQPATNNLSMLSKEDLPESIRILKSLDDNTIEILVSKIQDILHLKSVISETLDSGNNVYFCGCGATGRLSLTIETLWRQVHRDDDLKDRVFSFMAGGDVALIRSIENFEDFTHYGARQLEEAGFRDGDLLVGTTEGGETPFVIGAVERASEISHRKPFFLYCNPDDILSLAAERSKRVILNERIEKINLTVGPMAVTGSTRMQSSTILLAAAGSALLWSDESDSVLSAELERFRGFWKNADLGFLEGFTELESAISKKGEYILYEADRYLGVTIITDTTERSPTFSLYPFENENEPELPPSLCYLFMPQYPDSRYAWNQLLWRAPRTLEWPEIDGIASMKRLLGFDFSAQLLSRRNKLTPGIPHHHFIISSDDSGLSFTFDNLKHIFPAAGFNPLFIHLMLKMILNTHSTLVMGRLERYEGNVMTYVRASNNKLIDRAVRYIDLILRKKNLSLSYSELTHLLFRTMEKTPFDQAIVLQTAEEAEKYYAGKKGDTL